MNQGWCQPVMAQQASGPLLTNFTTAKSVISSQAVGPISPSMYSLPGQDIQIRLAGAISNVVTTPGTITFQVMFGSIVVWSSGAVQLNASAHTTLPFELNVTLTLQALGSGTSAKFIGIGRVAGPMFTKTAGQTDNVNSDTVIVLPTGVPAQGNGFDSTVAQVLDIWAGFSVLNAANGIQVHQYSVDSKN